MKAGELRSKSVEELNAELVSLLRSQFGFRVQAAKQQLTDTSRLMKMRRDVARVHTLLREKMK